MQRLKALKRGQKRERREAAARDALKEAQAAMPTSPRQAASRLRADRSITPTRAWQVAALPAHIWYSGQCLLCCLPLQLSGTCSTASSLISLSHQKK